MVRITVLTKRRAEAEARLLPGRLEHGLRWYAARFEEEYQRGLKRGGHVATGALAGLRAVVVPSRSGGIRVVVHAPRHFRFLEQGTRPHWAPIAPLLTWARTKVADEGDAVSLAYAVRATIARRGTKAYPVAREAAKRMAPGLDVRLDAALRGEGS